MTEGLKHDQRREATASIRGYVYQAYQSVLAWMHLRKSEILFLEGAEDFDIHENDTVTTTQVKDTAARGSVTLRSKDVVEALSNFWKHQQVNADRIIHLRFLTTAVTGQEKDIHLPVFQKGLHYWEHAARDESLSIAPLRDFLLSLDLIPDLKDFLKKADDRTIRDQLIRRIHWDTGCRPKDALIADIKDSLVFHGHTKGVDSRQSERTLDSLLREVADLLSSESNRSVTFADFCRAFDEATMELMPRGEAAALRQIISHTALTDLIAPADSAVGAIPVLGPPLPLVHGATKRESLVRDLTERLLSYGALIIRGSTGMGKTSVARLITDHVGGQWFWAGFRGRGKDQIASQLRQAVFEIKAFPPPANIVFDDLDLSDISLFEREFLSVVFSITNDRGLVLITAPNNCPGGLLEKLWIPDACNIEIPRFDEAEIKDLISKHGGKDIQQIEGWSRAIFLTTAGHPQLVHARVRNLVSKSWPPLKASDIFQPVDVEKERDFARRRIITEVPSDNARLLAYRLSLLLGQFSTNLAIGIAGLSPIIPMPGEVFDSLVGPWVEQVSDDHYRISPLLQNAGDKILQPADIQLVHEGIALLITGRKTISQYDVGTALFHALIAKSEKVLSRLAAGILKGTSERNWRALADAVPWFPVMACEPGQHLCYSNANVDLLLRFVQFRVAAAEKKVKEALGIIDRVNDLLDGFSPGNVAAVNATAAYATFLISVEVPISPEKLVYMLSRMIDFKDSEQGLQKLWSNVERSQKAQLRLAGLSPVQALFSIRASNMTGINDLSSLLDALEALAPEKRAHLLNAFKDNSFELADFLVANAWFQDTAKQTFDVNHSITVLRKSVDFGHKWDLPELVRASFVAMAVLYDEYGQSQNSALAVLEEAASELSKNDSRLLNQRAKVFFNAKQYSQALDLFSTALKDNKLPEIERTFSSRLAAISAANLGEWKTTERFFLDAAAAARANQMRNTMAIGLAADAALAKWKRGQKRDALILYKEILGDLELVPIDQNLQSRHLHAVIRHSLGWIDTSGRLGKDDPLTELPPGACSNPNPHPGMLDLNIVSTSAVWGLLGNIDTRLDTGLGLAQFVEEKYKPHIPIFIRLHERLAKFEGLWQKDDFSQAVPIMIGFTEAVVHQKSTEGYEINSLMETSQIPTLDDGYWADSKNRGTLLCRLLSLAVLATAKKPEAKLPLDQWKDDLRTAGILGDDVENFFKVFSGEPGALSRDLFEDATWSLFKIREIKGSLVELFSYHFRILNFLTAGDWGMFVADAFVNMLMREWLDAAENQKFALRSPSIHRPLIKNTCQDTGLTGYALAASILEVAADAIGTNVSDSGKQFLRRLIAGEFPIQNLNSSH